MWENSSLPWEKNLVYTLLNVLEERHFCFLFFSKKWSWWESCGFFFFIFNTRWHCCFLTVREDFWLQPPVRNFEWGSCYPISYPHIILVLRLKSVWSVLPTLELTPKILVIWYRFQLYHVPGAPWWSQALSPPAVCTPYAYLECKNVLTALPIYPAPGRAVLILCCDPWKQMYPKLCPRTWYVQICMVVTLLFTSSS